ncbi:MAG: type IV secretory system conjugative DNA transfer family protein [Oscillospiraceae bacterium]|nr:type IV secretory system conjugative DNA transfer family protein [Oscillospiraceae bacterium]
MGKLKDFENISGVFLDIINNGAIIFRKTKKLRGKNPQKQSLQDQRDIRKGNNVPWAVLSSDEGFYLGEKYYEKVLKSSTQNGNICVLGRTGDGKSTCFVNPTMETWRDTMVVIDLEGSAEKYYKSLERSKRPFKVLNFMNGAENVFTYDPFYMIRQAPDEYVIPMIKELVHILIPMPPDKNGENEFWIESAQNILTGALIYYYNTDSGFIDSLNKIQTTPLAVLMKNIVDDKDETAKIYMSQLIEIKDFSDNKMALSIKLQVECRQ